MAKQKIEKQKSAVKTAIKSEAKSLLPGEKIYPAIIFAFSFLLYLNSVFNGYNMDDELVTQNHRLTSKGISAIPEIFSSPYYEDQAGYKYEYRPVVLATFAIEHSLFGDSPQISHFINVLLYSALCLLLFFVLRNILHGYSLILSFLITLLFAAYPLHTEVVASIKNRDETLALLFGLLSLHYALLFITKKRSAYLLGVCSFFLLAILSKTTSITFALLIPLTIVMFHQVPLLRLLTLTVSLAVPAVFFARLYSFTQQLGLFVLLLAAVVILYGLQTGLKKITAQAAEFISAIFTEITTIEKNQTEESPPLDYFSNISKNWISLFLFGTLTLLCFAVAIITARTNNMGWLSGLPLLALALTFVLVRPELKLLLIPPITFLSVLFLVAMHVPKSSVLESALLVFLGAVVTHKNKFFKITGLLCFAGYAVAMTSLNHTFYFAAGAMFLVLLHNKGRWVSYLIAAAWLVFSIKSLITKSTGLLTLSVLSLPVIIAGAVFVWRQKNNWAIQASVLLIPVFVSVYAQLSPAKQPDVFYGIKETYSAVSHVKAATTIPVQTVRPFHYIEIPLADNEPLTVKLGTAMLVLSKYLKLALIPFPMSFYYGYAYISPVKISGLVPMLSLLIHLLLALTAIYFYKKEPLLSFSILFYLISISVFSNLFVQVPGMMGDRFLFIPSIGVCTAVVFLFTKIFKQSFTQKQIAWKELAKPFSVSFSILLVLYSLISFSRNRDWKDRITLFSRDIKTVENSAQAQNLLAVHLLLQANNEPDPLKQKQMREESLKHFDRAIEIYPHFLNPVFDRARLLESMRRYDEALAGYKAATAIDTGFLTPYFSMGIIYQNKGMDKEAAQCYEKYLPAHPLQMEVYANLSYAYFKIEQFDKSIATNQRAIAVSPNSFDPYLNIGKTYMHLKQTDSAIVYFEKAIALKPNDTGLAATIEQLKAGK